MDGHRPPLQFSRPNDTIRPFMRASETLTRSDFVALQDNRKPIVSIVVPAFNEAGRIGASIKKIDAFMRESPLSLELIVVDDGSSDNTAEIVRPLQGKGVRLLQND